MALVGLITFCRESDFREEFEFPEPNYWFFLLFGFPPPTPYSLTPDFEAVSWKIHNEWWNISSFQFLCTSNFVHRVLHGSEFRDWIAYWKARQRNAERENLMNHFRVDCIIKNAIQFREWKTAISNMLWLIFSAVFTRHSASKRTNFYDIGVFRKHFISNSATAASAFPEQPIRYNVTL